MPRCLCVSGGRESDKITRSKVETASAIGTPEFSCNANDKLLALNIVQNDKARALEPLRWSAGDAIPGRSLSSSDGH
jgi:hypothetical protein